MDLCARGNCQHFCTVGREEIAQWLALGETPQEQILRPAALHTTGQCESRETRLHTNIPSSRAPLNYAGERESPISLSTQQQHLMACVAVIRVTVHFVYTVAISACIGLTVINVPGHLFSGHYFQSKRSWKLPGTFEPQGLEFCTECPTPVLVGPAPVALYNRLRTSRAKESDVPSSVRTLLLWCVTSAQLHPCSQTVFTKREQRQAQHLEGWQRLRQHGAPGDHNN